MQSECNNKNEVKYLMHIYDQCKAYITKIPHIIMYVV